MSHNDTDIHDPDGIIFSGKTIGHADERSTVRKRDGVFVRGDEMGYVDKSGEIHRPDKFIFKGEHVGQVKGNRAYDKDGIIFSGEEWGYIDSEGNVRQKDGLVFRGRIIGTMKGKDKAAALSYFVLRFKEMEDKYKVLEQDVRSAKNKASFIGKVKHMLGWVPEVNALGDFDGLLNRLKSLEREILNQMDDSRRSKEALVRRAESLSCSTKWKEAGEEMKTLQLGWKEVKSAGREQDESLWERFRHAQDQFYKKRTEHFDKQKREWAENQRKKERLISEAESLSHQSDTKGATERVKELQAEWKTIGHVSRESADDLWDRFRRACDRVFEQAKKERERKAAEWEKGNKERRENLRRKERLCDRAESLYESGDPKEATERVKELQAEWKTIGPVPKEDAEDLWERFRRACDRVFTWARAERERKQNEWRDRMEEALDRKIEQADRLRESIDHDKDNVSRWEDTISNLRDGGRADEIRDSLEDKISDVEDKIRSKERRLDEIESIIEDIRNKLRR